MVQNNKILTVSYGAFSCTLEGFDDSLVTMKAVAGYFRDLTSEDRYFGAEPPQPDTDALPRIDHRISDARRGDIGSAWQARDSAHSHDLRPAMSPTTASESIAAKLQRIRAVVSRNEGLDSDCCEDEPTDVFISAAADDISHALRHEDDVFHEAPDDAADDELSRALGRVDEGTPTAPEPADSLTDDPLATAEDRAGKTMTGPSVSISTPLNWPDDETGALGLDAVAVEYAGMGEVFAAPDTVPAENDPVAVHSIVTSVLTDGTDRVDRVSSAESGASGEISGSDRPAHAAFFEVEIIETLERSLFAEGSLSTGEEEVSWGDEEGEPLVEGEIDHDTTGIVDDAEHQDQNSRDTPSAQDEPSDADLTRLMQSAEVRMGDVEIATGRETYDRMRAAVAAAEASDDDLPEDDHATAYRDDLADTVRPRRPVAAGSRTRRPTDNSRPAPLRLVAEQRVDLLPERTATDPVHPRRIALASVDSGSGLDTDDGAFAKFAADMGATALPELLEAAAAYLSFVEKCTQFSRPQLMNKLRQLDNPAFNHEDGLRSFGELLRDGKIEKAGDGRFTASDDIGFRPGKRAVG